MANNSPKTNDQLEWVLRIITQAQTGKFYGQIKIHLKGGEIDLVERVDSLKPPKTK